MKKIFNTLLLAAVIISLTTGQNISRVNTFSIQGDAFFSAITYDTGFAKLALWNPDTGNMKKVQTLQYKDSFLTNLSKIAFHQTYQLLMVPVSFYQIAVYGNYGELNFKILQVIDIIDPNGQTGYISQIFVQENLLGVLDGSFARMCFFSLSFSETPFTKKCVNLPTPFSNSTIYARAVPVEYANKIILMDPSSDKFLQYDPFFNVVDFSYPDAQFYMSDYIPQIPILLAQSNKANPLAYKTINFAYAGIMSMPYLQILQGNQLNSKRTNCGQTQYLALQQGGNLLVIVSDNTIYVYNIDSQESVPFVGYIPTNSKNLFDAFFYEDKIYYIESNPDDLIVGGKLKSALISSLTLTKPTNSSLLFTK